MSHPSQIIFKQILFILHIFSAITRTPFYSMQYCGFFFHDYDGDREDKRLTDDINFYIVMLIIN